jgi:cobalamin biosynthesis protein CobT
MLNIESKMEVFAKTYSKDTGVEVVMGSQYCTDGRKIYVVPVSDQADPALRAKTEVIVYHETGHIKTKDVKHLPKGSVQKRIYNWIRDVVVEHTMETEYPGMKVKWAEFLTTHIKESKTKPQAWAEPLYNKIMRALYLTCRGKQVGVNLETSMTPEVQELFDKKFAKFVDAICNESSVKSSLALTEEIYKSFTQEEKEQPKNGQSQQKQKGKGSSKKDDSTGADDPGDQVSEEENVDDNSEGAGEDSDDGDDKETGAGNPEDETEDVDDEDSKGKGDQTGDTDGDEAGDSDPDDGGAEDDPASSGQTDDPATAGDQPGGNSSGDDSELSDEAKEALEQAKEEIENGCDEGKTIAEETTDELNEYVQNNKVYRVEPGLKEDFQPIEHRYGWEHQVNMAEQDGRAMVGYLGGKMKRLFISERAPVWQRNIRSGKLDIRKTWKVAVGSQDIMRRKTVGKYEDACVFEVIDHSDSMNGTKARMAQAILTTVSTDLDKLRIPFGAVGFTMNQMSTSESDKADDGVRSKPIVLNHIKGFNEAYRRVRSRFIWPTNCNLTCELPAIEYAAKQLAMRRETKKILFILTDGETFTGSGTLNSALREATKEYIHRLLNAGVKVVGIGIQDRSISRYCPDFIHVTNLNNFGHDFYRKLTQLIL